ncbi:sugar ABC transporter substrate-binding protein [Paenibacillus psychroresistens]|uniref:Sugar ABC transporter substrate-binding protein n=1 Tax=Paenibacillus psychroresistens TaxID=1778678 RepID=A0A6B8RFJ5_9BACL|nr:sugar ABC transporter substrate-binding protein [Paenibacillus psychroresistens]QGQ94136.1 sugar ABC transporter substrate-binding protein [Paenibacillus psychroresistens]
MKKRILISMLSTFLMATIVLSGCSKKEETAASSTKPTTEATVAPDATAAPAETTAPVAEEISGKVTYAQWGTAEETTQAKALLKEFNLKYPKVEVEVISKDWGTYWTSLTAQAASKDLPDVYKISFAYVEKYAKLGAMKDLTDLIASNNFDLNDFEPALLAAHQFEGKQVSLPRDANIVEFAYNKGLFEDPKTNPSKAPFPTGEMTWDQTLEIAKKMTLDKNGKNPTEAGFDAKNIVQWGVASGVTNFDSVLEPQLISSGAKIVNDDKTLALDSPEAMKTLEFFRGLVDKEHVAPSSATIQTLGGDPFLSLASGKVAMSFAGSWSAGEFKKANIKFEYILPPKFNTTQTVVQPAGNVMSPNSKNEKAAWALLSWLSGPDGQNALAKSGSAIPANKKAAEAYLAIDAAFDKKAIIDAQKYAITTPFFDGKDKLLWEILPQKMPLPLDGKGDLVKAIKEVKELYGK